jgi:hypothetical protein
MGTALTVVDPQVFLSHEAKSDKLLYHGRQHHAKSCIIYLKELTYMKNIGFIGIGKLGLDDIHHFDSIEMND